jgi:hypothetical protein
MTSVERGGVTARAISATNAHHNTFSSHKIATMKTSLCVRLPRRMVEARPWIEKGGGPSGESSDIGLGSFCKPLGPMTQAVIAEAAFPTPNEMDRNAVVVRNSSIQSVAWPMSTDRGILNPKCKICFVSAASQM